MRYRVSIWPNIESMVAKTTLISWLFGSISHRHRYEVSTSDWCRFDFASIVFAKTFKRFPHWEFCQLNTVVKLTVRCRTIIVYAVWAKCCTYRILHITCKRCLFIWSYFMSRTNGALWLINPSEPDYIFGDQSWVDFSKNLPIHLWHIH